MKSAIVFLKRQTSVHLTFDSLARDVFDYDLRTKHIHNKDDIIKYIYEQLSFSFKDDAISQQIQTREQTIDYLVQQFNKQLKRI